MTPCSLVGAYCNMCRSSELQSMNIYMLQQCPVIRVQLTVAQLAFTCPTRVTSRAIRHSPHRSRPESSESSCIWNQPTSDEKQGGSLFLYQSQGGRGALQADGCAISQDYSSNGAPFLCRSPTRQASVGPLFRRSTVHHALVPFRYCSICKKASVLLNRWHACCLLHATPAGRLGI